LILFFDAFGIPRAYYIYSIDSSYLTAPHSGQKKKV